MAEPTADPAATATASAATTTAPVTGAPPAAPQPGAATTATSQSTGAEATSSNSFDAAPIEEAFGLPAGTLKDVKDNDSALSAVDEYINKVTVAGIGLPSPLEQAKLAAPVAAAPATPQPGQPAAKPVEGQPQYMTRADLDAYYAEKETAQQTAQFNAFMGELDRRLDAEIDSWASPQYGVGKQRNVKQIKAHAEVKDMIKTHIAGAVATGQVLPQAEILARRIRRLEDTTYTPGKPVQAAAPLGTPGAAKAVTTENKDGPRNIHEAVLGRKIS